MIPSLSVGFRERQQGDQLRQLGQAKEDGRLDGERDGQILQSSLHLRDRFFDDGKHFQATVATRTQDEVQEGGETKPITC